MPGAKVTRCAVVAPAGRCLWAGRGVAFVTGLVPQGLEDLAALGNKRAGTDAGIQAGNYVHDRFRAAGLSDADQHPAG